MANRPKQRQIRANFDEETITVYQAYNSEIASSAVQHQKLSASPQFKLGRMTWIKPSWCWMMYRAGYSYKDRNQERILALKMKHDHFIELLEKSAAYIVSRDMDGIGYTHHHKGALARKRQARVRGIQARARSLLDLADANASLADDGSDENMRDEEAKRIGLGLRTGGLG